MPHRSSIITLTVVAFGAWACGGDDDMVGETDPGSTTMATLALDSSTTGTPTSTSSLDGTGAMTSGDTTGTAETGTSTGADPSGESGGSGSDGSASGGASETEGDGSGTGTLEGGSSTGEPDPYDPLVFRDIDPSEYRRVDRIGKPGISRFLIADQDAYNQDDPVDDPQRPFIGTFGAAVEGLLVGSNAWPGDGLTSELEALGFMPCVPRSQADINDQPVECIEQLYPWVIPDVLPLRLDEPSAFPNGATLDDRIFDMTLAVILLNLDESLEPFGGEYDPYGHALDAFFDIGGGVSLNPVANDVPNAPQFPFLADPHE